jgi:hypothetical protein
MMEGVVRSIKAKGKHSEDAERKLVTGVSFMGLDVAVKAPTQHCPEVGSRTEEDWTCVPGKVVDENMFYWMSVLAGDASCVDELVVLLVEHLIHR